MCRTANFQTAAVLYPRRLLPILRYFRRKSLPLEEDGQKLTQSFQRTRVSNIRALRVRVPLICLGILENRPLCPKNEGATDF